ncbi:MAG: GAF domain-containing sensor histidine kinase [Armatimonadetes bacterium]|nr:GAF domain-containing sensor histidine kinase [Armatimonadota bacterium]
MLEAPPEPQRMRAARLRDYGAAPLDVSHLRCLLDCAQVVNSSLDLPTVLDHILIQAMGVLRAESGSVMLLDPDRQELLVLAARGPRAESVCGRSQKVGQGIAGWVALNGKPLLLHGKPEDWRYELVCERSDVRDALCVPLTAEGEIIGVISLNNRLRQQPFASSDLELLTALTHHAGLAIRNARLYEETQRQHQAVERLLSGMVTAQEEERKRIALELHDGPAQSLFAALRAVEATQSMLADLPPSVAEELKAADTCIRQAIEELRGVMTDIRPPSLDDLGLVTGLRQYARYLSERSGLEILVIRRGLERRLPATLEVALYRVAQEALANVWKHARARKATVVVDIDQERCTLEVIDDGIGFATPPDGRSGELKHMGLATVRERVELMGGQLDVRSVSERGTTISVTVPF